MGVAALILTGSYKDQEFVRVGYYQNTEYDNEEMKIEVEDAQGKMLKPVLFDKLVRDINNKPRVTRFQIKWCVRRVALLVLCSRAFIYRDLPQTNMASAGAATSAAVPSADTYEDVEDVDMEQKDAEAETTSSVPGQF
jgi:histone chaperone ASF1